MTTGYLFRLYASPWKILYFLVGFAALATYLFYMLFHSDAPSDTPLDAWGTINLMFLFVVCGLLSVVYGTLFLILVITRRPLLAITPNGWRFFPISYPIFWGVTRMEWSEIAGVGIHRHGSGRSVRYFLVVIPRLPSGLDPMLFGGIRRQINLSIAFVRVAPEKCERLLNDITTACASEIAQHAVYIEPKIWGMM